jgi:signal transduction histidine kinase
VSPPRSRRAAATITAHAPVPQDRVEPFFTTKPLGKGTGQGLAIARSAIVDKHGGELDFESGTDGGTTFIVRLPLGADIPNPENNLT